MSTKKTGSVDFNYLGDKKVEKGKKNLLEQSAGWKGPNRSARQEEVKETAKRVHKLKTQKEERVSWKKKAGGIAAVLFLCGVGLFNFISTISGFLIGIGIQHIDVLDTPKLKSILFGGDPWLIYCVTNETKHQKLPKVLEDSASERRSIGLNTGVLPCWEATQSGRSVAQRFKMNLKPPLAFVVANGNKPRVLNLVGISKPEELQKRVTPALKLETYKIDALKKWPTHCTSRRTCVVIGHKQIAQRDTALTLLKPLLERHRSVKIVTLDTSFWQLKLDEAVMTTRQQGGQKGADVLCLSRDDGAAGANVTHSGSFLQTFDSSSAASFVEACEKQTDLVRLKFTPKINARPSKPKVVSATAPQRQSPRPTPAPPSKTKNAAKVDHVGSRDSLEEDEPLFEAVEEGEFGEGEQGSNEADEEEEEDPNDEVEL